MRNRHAQQEPAWVKAAGFVFTAIAAALFLFALSQPVAS